MSNRLLWILIILGFIWVWYLYYNLSYLPKKELIIVQELERNVLEEIKEPELVKQVLDKVELSNTQKIEDIKEKKNNYRTFSLENNRKAYFTENNNSLDLYLDTKKIWNFELVYSQYLRVEFIKGSESDLYIEVWSEKFYYNENYNEIVKIDLNIDIQYVKEWINSKIIFVTTKWSFIYSRITRELNYFSYFNDFVYFNDWYIGLVKREDKRILNNLGIKLDKESIITYYNPNTKEKTNIYLSDVDIINIYEENNKVYIVNSFGDLFELENI